jgi:hypothetical protein
LIPGQGGSYWRLWSEHTERERERDRETEKERVAEESGNFCAKRVGECRPEISRGAKLDSWGRVKRFLTKKKKE